MSDSELSTPANLPADAEIEQCLRRVVRDALKADEEMTTNRARTLAEEELGLDTGFLKDNAEWKQRSKDIVSAAVNEPESPEKPKKSAPKPKAEPAAKAGMKRKSEESQPKKKRQKKAATPVSDEEDVEDEVAEVESPKPRSKKAVQRPKLAVDDSEAEADETAETKKTAPPTKSEDESALSEPPEDTEPRAPKANGKPTDDSESDMSVLIDDPPPKKKRQKKSTSSTEPKDKDKKSAKPAKTPKELSPDEEEIKRLQGWLVKCGIRKVWGVELKKYETPKHKIKHLKGMLSEAGMTGRYSAEKASQIREARELAAEIEAAKEFNEKWGQKGDGEEGEDGSEEEVEEKGDGRTKRLRPKGLIDFGDSGDDE